MSQHEVTKGQTRVSAADSDIEDLEVFDYQDLQDISDENSDELQVFDWDSQEEEEVGADEREEVGATRSKSSNRRLGSLLVVELGLLTVTWLFSQAPWNGFVANLIALIWTSLAVLTLATSGLFVLAEYLSIRRIRRIEACREEAKCIGKKDDREARWRFLRAVKKAYCGKTRFKQDVDRKARSTAVTDRELKDWLETEALAAQDKKCHEEVKRLGLQSGALVAVSFNVRLDLLITLWRATSLVFVIADIYEVRGGVFTKVKILRAVVGNLAFVGITQYISNTSAMKGGNAVLNFGARWLKLDEFTQAMAQGVGAGLLTARVGANAMHVCRPVALRDSQYQSVLNAIVKKFPKKASEK